MPKEITLPDFVYSNLNTYGNTLVPKKTVDKYGKKEIRGKLTRYCGRTIHMRETEYGYFVAEKV